MLLTLRWPLATSPSAHSSSKTALLRRSSRVLPSDPLRDAPCRTTRPPSMYEHHLLASSPVRLPPLGPKLCNSMSYEPDAWGSGLEEASTPKNPMLRFGRPILHHRVAWDASKPQVVEIVRVMTRNLSYRALALSFASPIRGPIPTRKDSETSQVACGTSCVRYN